MVCWQTGCRWIGSITQTREITMVRYIGTARIRELLARQGVAAFIEELAREIELDYRRWEQFEKSARLASHSRDGVIELMPISDGRLYAFKYVNGHPKNTVNRLLTVTAFGALADVATGYPVLVSEMTVVTALRTAAVSALAARGMARPDSRIMAIIGNGAQSEFQALAFHQLLRVRELRLFDIDPHATQKLERNLAALRLPGLVVTRCGSTAEAVRGADIVTTATADKRNAVILEPDMIAAGMHLNAIGGDCPGKTELHVDILRRPDARIVVEFEPQARIEGEIQQLAAGAPRDSNPTVIELSDVLSGRQPGRRNAAEVTIFDSVGFALNDFSALCYLQRLEAAQSDSESLDLIPRLEDPKNLFAALREPATRPRSPGVGAKLAEAAR
jgi:ornithine cyclodeaminase